jgi:tRNA (mo5U34)-methyltransferase
MQRGSDSIEQVSDNYDFWQTDIFDSDNFPRIYFIEHRHSSDPTNWWIPNRACTEAMLRSSGLTIIGHPEKEVYKCRRGEISGNQQRAVYPERK